MDLYGIGGPGTSEAQLWHEIAAKHGVICPYGPNNPVEWNHCQPTQVKIIFADSPLRETVTAEGPISLESMFEVGKSLIANIGNVGAPSQDPPVHFLTAPYRVSAEHLRPSMAAAVNVKIAINPRIIQTGRFPFKGVAFKGPPLDGVNVGAIATGGMVRVVAVEGPRVLKSRSASTTIRASKPKPIVISRILAAHSARHN